MFKANTKQYFILFMDTYKHAQAKGETVWNDTSQTGCNC